MNTALLDPKTPFQCLIRCQTAGEFDPWFTVWLIDPDDPEEVIDVVFEDEDLRRCHWFCEHNGYEIIR